MDFKFMSRSKFLNGDYSSLLTDAGAVALVFWQGLFRLDHQSLEVEAFRKA